ncbi:MAG: hypothetical protein K0B05_11060 [Bacteroidales bacterium]|nr:hypothetical protein [Bacteroidales bacterium]
MNGSWNKNGRDGSQTRLCRHNLILIFVVISLICFCCGNAERGLRPLSDAIYVNNQTGNDNNPGTGSFFIWNGSGESGQLAGCYIHNNVVYSTSAPVISFENDSDHENFVFSNNIFMGAGQLISGTNKGSKFLGNVWWTAGGEVKFGEFTSLAEWAGATGQETINGKIAGLQSDPLLNGPLTTNITDPYQLGALTGFKLKPESPLMVQGVGVLTVPGIGPPSVDFFGTPLPGDSAPVPGIYEKEQIQKIK